jgi:hypothetical protein
VAASCSWPRHGDDRARRGRSFRSRRECCAGVLPADRPDRLRNSAGGRRGRLAPGSLRCRRSLAARGTHRPHARRRDAQHRGAGHQGWGDAGRTLGTGLARRGVAGPVGGPGGRRFPIRGAGGKRQHCSRRHGLARRGPSERGQCRSGFHHASAA